MQPKLKLKFFNFSGSTIEKHFVFNQPPLFESANYGSKILNIPYDSNLIDIPAKHAFSKFSKMSIHRPN